MKKSSQLWLLRFELCGCMHNYIDHENREVTCIQDDANTDIKQITDNANASIKVIHDRIRQVVTQGSEVATAQP